MNIKSQLLFKERFMNLTTEIGPLLFLITIIGSVFACSWQKGHMAETEHTFIKEQDNSISLPPLQHLLQDKILEEVNDVIGLTKWRPVCKRWKYYIDHLSKNHTVITDTLTTKQVDLFCNKMPSPLNSLLLNNCIFEKEEDVRKLLTIRPFLKLCGPTRTLIDLPSIFYSGLNNLLREEINKRIHLGNIPKNVTDMPLHYAVVVKTGAELKALINAKASHVNQPDEYNRTPLHYATFSGTEEAVQWLLEEKANENIQDRNKQIPLHIALSGAAYLPEYGNWLAIIEKLIDSRSDVHAKDRHGQTPLQIAFNWATKIPDSKNVLAIIEKLIDHGADVNTKDWYGKTPWTTALNWAIKTPDSKNVLAIIE
eukprot:gene1068-1353_t